MPFIKRLFSWALSGPRVWFWLFFVVFIFLLLVYKSLVPVTDNPQDYVLPDNKSSADAPRAPRLASNQTAEEVDQAELSADESDAEARFTIIDPLQQIETVKAPIPAIEYVIKSGDTLGRIFSRLGLSRESMYAVLEADQEYLVLEPLIPKDKFTFKIDEKGELLQITRRLDVSKSVSYVRHGRGGFTYEEQIKPIRYTQTVIHSKITSSFYLSAKKIGLSDANILMIHDVLQGRVNFRKDLRVDDTFDVVVKKGSIDGIRVGETQLEALQITVKGQTYRAFFHSDGRFYDQDGNSLTPALLRWPTKQEYRISSSFNANRLHPITGHPAPHNGVDLATPSGTEVLATGDGIVTRVANHKYAGKYVVVNYTGPYGSRFLHLNKVLVKQGQQVKRGQVIALSGNTGRTTGAHLHYELHVRGRPVNPMTAQIPTTQSVPQSQRQEYDANVQQWIEMMTSKAAEKPYNI
ncbi:peptidoglycan DD-metalloendopeptidase family protein [Marinomonas sp. M1K-6]|uniref:Peptidoglycan DD-metalloendopeptidase family protein n=1 Tax=Marinomonas profundi TaxID=2726122 RepID=A0A847RAV3_9GAMM|nr:peptidoglycan DD-metalloendopeptidase family protein [Marinomonas profundi]NLQ18357.1 peptidoglycan DD-metalloendopeptidase family protein [Marinomonas profundi]UDV02419.1 peptidoglycan DD-metalloendopeptidase family protein [Marinomonas profundi]